MTFVLEPIIDGNDSGETIVFVQGWPDDASLWDRQVAVLGKTYRCVRVTLPNFGGTKTTRWGYTTDEIVEALADCVRRVNRGKPVTFVLHDWGSYWGHALHHRYPDLAWRVVGLDVAPHYEPGPGAIAGIMAYQFWLLGAFLAGGSFGNWMTRSMVRRLRVPADPDRLDAWMNYPYRNVWLDLVSGRARKNMHGYYPQGPLLFVHGKKKPFPFHSKKWTDHVESVGGTVVGLECGHWVTEDPSFTDLLAKWLARTDPVRAAR